ncbi:MAG: ComF family protein [Bacteroidetes bacterium]|nr:ComF family protein [Bacteroidota bacterium]
MIYEILNFFLPNECLICRTYLPQGRQILCAECHESLPIATEEEKERQFNKAFRTSDIENFESLYSFTKNSALQDLVHELKYNQRFTFGKFLGKCVAEELRTKLNEWNIDCLLPIPLHHVKRSERGYNQAYYIAKGLSESLSIPVDTNLIKRVRFTQTQTALNSEQRKLNVMDAFRINKKKKIKIKTVALIDDVITTGSTMKECARILKSAGVEKIYAISVGLA